MYYYNNRGSDRYEKILIVVDMQKDFVDGSLGTAEAVGIVDNAAKKIENFDGDIIVTYDTHAENYLETQEGKNLPVVHCIKGTDGWQLNEAIQEALNKKRILYLKSLPLVL